MSLHIILDMILEITQTAAIISIVYFFRKDGQKNELLQRLGLRTLEDLKNKTVGKD